MRGRPKGSKNSVKLAAQLAIARESERTEAAQQETIRGHDLSNTATLRLEKCQSAIFPLLDEHGAPSRFGFEMSYVPWADTVSREDWFQAMTFDDDEKSARLADLLRRPENRNVPMSILAGQANIRVPQLFLIYRAYMRYAAQLAITRKAQKIADDTATDAESRFVCCTRCDGAGEIRVMKGKKPHPLLLVCPTCEGTGRERRTGDVKSREWALQSSGVIKTEAAPLVNINMGGVDSVLDELEHMESGPVVNVAPSPDDA